MEEITRRAVLATLAAVPVVAKVDVDSLDEDEVDVLMLGARDLSDTEMGAVDKKTFRTRWDIDPKRYPMFDRDDEVMVVCRSLSDRGLMELREAYAVLSDGREVDRFYATTERGRAALAAHAAKVGG